MDRNKEIQEWVERLIDSNATESPTLDFKRKPPDLKTDEAKRAFLFDIVALANSRGGHIVYGVEEENGSAVRPRAITDNVDNIVNGLSQLATHCIQPRIAGIRFDPVIVDGGHAIVAEVPQQFDGPFLASLGDQQWFKCRQSQTNANMTYDQIRGAFGARDRLISAIRSWRKERIELLAHHISTRRMRVAPWSALHVMPVAAFTDPNPFDFIKAERPRAYNSSRYNLDGILYSLSDPNKLPTRQFQVFRHGMIEVTWASGSLVDANDGHRDPRSIEIARSTIEGIHHAAKIIRAGGIEGPVAIGYALLNAGNTTMIIHVDDHFQNTGHELLDTEIILPDEMTATVLDLSAHPIRTARPHMNMLWQAYGEESCAYISDDNEWLLESRVPLDLR